MKKIFTSIMMLGAVAAMSAQNLHIQKGADGEVVYENGETVEISVEQTWYGDDYFTLQWDPEFYIVADAACNAIVSVNSPKGFVQFCGGTTTECINTSTTNPAVKQFALQPNAPQNMVIDILDMTGSYPFSDDIETTVTATYNGKTYSLKVIFKATSAGVNEVSTDVTKVAVEGRTLHYYFAQPTLVTLYTISGQPAMTHTVNGAGSLSLDALPGGVYLYRAGARTGKFVVR